MFRICSMAMVAGLIGLWQAPRIALASEPEEFCAGGLTASPSFDARIRDELVENERVTVRIYFKPAIDLDTLPAEERALIEELERANPGCTNQPGFVSRLLVLKHLNAVGDKARLSFMDLSPTPLAEVNRVTFEEMVRSAAPWVDRIAFATPPKAIVQ